MFKIAMSFAALTLALCIASANAAGPYPSLVLKNQFGETSINSITGGSNQIDCNFIVDSTNGNGLGIRSLKGSGCSAVYMHTSATPASGNPNPASGFISVYLSSKYTGYVGGYSGFVSPLSGSSVIAASGITQGNPYVITSLGTSTTANWQSIGLPTGLTPTVGQAFIATAPTGTGTGTVQAPATAGAGAYAFEVIGDANQGVTATSGANILIGVVGVTGGSGSAASSAFVAPADNSVVGLRFVMLPLASQLH